MRISRGQRPAFFIRAARPWASGTMIGSTMSLSAVGRCHRMGGRVLLRVIFIAHSTVGLSFVPLRRVHLCLYHIFIVLFLL